MYRNIMSSTRTCACRTAPWHTFLRGLAQVHRLDAASNTISPLRSFPSRHYSSLSKKSLRSLRSSMEESAEQDTPAVESTDAPPKPAKKRWRNMSVDELTEWHSALRWKKKAMKHERIQEERKEEEFLGQFEDVIVDKQSDANVKRTTQREKPVFVEKQQMDLEQVKMQRKIARAEAKKTKKPAKIDDIEASKTTRTQGKKGLKRETRPKRATKTNEDKSVAHTAHDANKTATAQVKDLKITQPDQVHVKSTPAIELDTEQIPTPKKPGKGRNARKKLRYREESLNTMNICVLPQRHDENPIPRGWLPSMTLQILESRKAEPAASDKLNPAELRKAEEWEAINRAAAFNFVLPRLHGRPEQSQLPALTLRVLGDRPKATDAALAKIKAKKPREVAERKGGRKISAARTKGSAAAAVAAVTTSKVFAPNDVDTETASAEEKRAGRKSRKEMADIARRKQMEKPLPGVKDYLKRQETRAIRKEQEAEERLVDPEAYAAKKAARAKKPQWALHKEALKKKFPTGWQPRKKLSPDALIGIRALNAEYPDVYTTQALSEKFEMDPEAIRRILKSKWEPSAEEEERRQKAWHERGLAIWERKAALGIKPPRRWRREGVAREPGWKEYRQKVARREREWEEGERERYRAQRASLSTRLAGKVL